MTTDPRICPDALRVKTISFEEAAELAYFGAKVLHPATILPAVQKNIPVWVLNSRNPENEGTKHHRHAARPAPAPSSPSPPKRSLTIIDIVASRMLLAHGFLKIGLRRLRQAQVRHRHGLDLRGLHLRHRRLREALPAICAELGQHRRREVEGDKALICLVGEDIRGHAGIAGQVFSAISHVNVRMISQGASEINMSFMINEEDVEEAIRSLHSKFFAAPDPAIFDVEARAVTTT